MNAGKLRPDPKPAKSEKKTKKYTYKKEPTGELPLFKKIWETRGPYSQVSGMYLGEFNVCFFAHILPKGKNKYPLFKLEPQNIVLMSLSEHHNFDNARYKCVGKEWEWVIKLEELLKEKYKLMLSK